MSPQPTKPIFLHFGMIVLIIATNLLFIGQDENELCKKPDFFGNDISGRCGSRLSCGCRLYL